MIKKFLICLIRDTNGILLKRIMVLEVTFQFFIKTCYTFISMVYDDSYQKIDNKVKKHEGITINIA